MKNCIKIVFFREVIHPYGSVSVDYDYYNFVLTIIFSISLTWTKKRKLRICLFCSIARFKWYCKKKLLRKKNTLFNGRLKERIVRGIARVSHKQ